MWQLVDPSQRHKELGRQLQLSFACEERHVEKLDDKSVVFYVLNVGVAIGQ